MTFGAPFGRVIAPPFGPRTSTAAAVNQWYLSGGVAAANCVSAYQPKGAASLAASYTNLASPGTYTAAPGVAPTWSAAVGWTFGGTNWLQTGVIQAAVTWSIVVRFLDAAAGTYVMAGAFKNPNRSLQVLANYLSAVTVGNGGSPLMSNSPAMTSGVISIANKALYRDGTYAADIGAGTTMPGTQIYIGAFNGDGPAILHYIGKIQAIAIYNVTLTAAQVAAISSAMALL